MHSVASHKPRFYPPAYGKVKATLSLSACTTCLETAKVSQLAKMCSLRFTAALEIIATFPNRFMSQTNHTYISMNWNFLMYRKDNTPACIAT